MGMKKFRRLDLIPIFVALFPVLLGVVWAIYVAA